MSFRGGRRQRIVLNDNNTKRAPDAEVAALVSDVERIKKAYSLLCGHKESMSAVPGAAGWFKISKPDVGQTYYWHASTGRLSCHPPELLEQREESEFRKAVSAAEASISRLEAQVGVVGSAQQAGGLGALKSLIDLLVQARNSFESKCDLSWDVVFSTIGKVADSLQETEMVLNKRSLKGLQEADQPPLPSDEGCPSPPPPSPPPPPLPPLSTTVGDPPNDEEPHPKKMKKLKQTFNKKPAKSAGDLMNRWAQARKELEEVESFDGDGVGDEGRLDEWRASQIRTGAAQHNPNFVALPGMWGGRAVTIRHDKTMNDGKDSFP